jgi:hypothetical protein
MAMTTSSDRPPGDVVKPRRAGLFDRDPDVPPWIHYPVRLVAVAVMVPLVLVWELLKTVGRGVEPYLVRPVVWFLRNVIARPIGRLLWYMVVVPVRAVGVALRWVWSLRFPLGRFLYRYGVWPLLRLGRYLVVVPLRAVGRALWWVLSVRYPLGRILYRYGVRPLGWLMRYGVGVPIVWLVRYPIVIPLRAVGAAIRWASGHAVRAMVVLLHFAVVVPARAVGAAMRWLWQQRVPLGRYLRRYVIDPPLWLVRFLVNMFVVTPLRWTAVALVYIGRLLGRALGASWHGARWLLGVIGRALWRYAIRPLWITIRTVWSYLVVAPARAIRWAWRSTVVAAGRWVRREMLVPAGHRIREAIVRPTRDVGRGVLIALGLRGRDGAR